MDFGRKAITRLGCEVFFRKANQIETHELLKL